MTFLSCSPFSCVLNFHVLASAHHSLVLLISIPRTCLYSLNVRVVLLATACMEFCFSTFPKIDVVPQVKASMRTLQSVLNRLSTSSRVSCGRFGEGCAEQTARVV